MSHVFRLAHVSDIHLGPLPPRAKWGDIRLKRIVGALSWRLRRRKLHDPAIAAMIAADIQRAAPDHVALTGDIVNIAAHAEFPRAARWIEALGQASDCTFVPGNHDCYVSCSWENGLHHLAPWMTGDMRVARTQTSFAIAAPFPFVRLRRNIALIGLSSALPQPLHRAAGKLGSLQLESLRVLLRELGERGFARVVLIHHPPLPGLAVPRRGLEDAGPLRDAIAQEGAELVLHGHNHTQTHSSLETRTGTAHILGVPSASMNGLGHDPPAAWNLCAVSRHPGRWATQVTVRSYNPAANAMEITGEFALSS